MKNLMPNEQHKENARQARRGIRTASPAWIPKRHHVRLEQDDLGNWRVFLNGTGSGIPATDVEVSLWLDLQELKEKQDATNEPG